MASKASKGIFLWASLMVLMSSFTAGNGVNLADRIKQNIGLGDKVEVGIFKMGNGEHLGGDRLNLHNDFGKIQYSLTIRKPSFFFQRIHHYLVYVDGMPYMPSIDFKGKVLVRRSSDGVKALLGILNTKDRFAILARVNSWPGYFVDKTANALNAMSNEPLN